MQNNWLVIELRVPGSSVDLVCALLIDLDCQGTVVEERRLDTFVVPDAELDPDRTYLLKAYFADQCDPQALHQQIVKIFSQQPGLRLLKDSVGQPSRVRMEDWAENWKQHFSRIKVGSRLVIRPSWEEYQPLADEVSIQLDPGMAFGTGTHGTTLLCLKMIAELFEQPQPPQSLLDVGTGSGILALGAAALGCETILANDIDPDACRVARENVAINGYEGQIEITSKPLEELPGQFDLVVANILAEENVRLKHQLFRHLQPGGWLVLSGILREKEQLVRDGFADLPLRDFPSRLQDDWACLIYRQV